MNQSLTLQGIFFWGFLLVFGGLMYLLAPRVRSESGSALNTELARLNRTAQEHVRQGRDALARLIYAHVAGHDPELGEVRKAQAALERLVGGPK